jgi:16S rRNA (guanine1207-N2)-methyltransferase
VCSADLPNAEFDLVAFPLKSRGEAELTHEMLQAGYLALREGGRMLASTDAPHDSWLHEQLRAMFPKVTREPEKKKGVRYLATKAGPLKKIKHFESEFAFRDQGRLIQAISRPGVFSHRRIDAGARTLINTMEVGEGFRVLDIGCGSGVVGLAAAFRAPGVSVLAVDSNARAIQCTERGAALNGLQTISTLLNAEGECDVPGTFDLAVGNPPYFSNYTIADIFLQAALRALKPGGQVLIVTKTPHWFEERMPQLFDDVQSTVAKNYYIVFSGRQRGDAAEA